MPCFPSSYLRKDGAVVTHEDFFDDRADHGAVHIDLFGVHSEHLYKDNGFLNSREGEKQQERGGGQHWREVHSVGKINLPVHQWDNCNCKQVQKVPLHCGITTGQCVCVGGGKSPGWMKVHTDTVLSLRENHFSD